ncbi:MAG: hypothetical protein AAFO63_06065 [Pseudomonadota bacterium]
MVVLEWIALGLIAISAACFFGPQFVAYGGRAFADLKGLPEARFVAGGLVSIAAMVLLLPYASIAAVEGGETVFALMIETATLSFGLV